ncbi:MAG: DMT family protein [Rikenellaceae bacterium]
MLQTGLTTIGLLIVSNVFMIFAWYGHLKLQETGFSASWPIYAVVLFSWAIALAEYAFQVPANRMGFIGNGGPFTLMQLKVMQEVITLTVFVIFANCFFQGSELKWNHLVAFVLLVGAVYFVFLDTTKYIK